MVAWSFTIGHNIVVAGACDRSYSSSFGGKEREIQRKKERRKRSEKKIFSIIHSQCSTTFS
jgi:hypothetical protein